MKTLYRLADDHEQIARMQKATLTSEEFGIVQTHGLIGAPEWWYKIRSGELPSQTLRGVISMVFMGSMGDWPEFRAKMDNGSEESFTRECTTADLDQEYQVGRTVEIDFVWQKYKKSWTGSDDARIVTEIRVDCSP